MGASETTTCRKAIEEVFATEPGVLRTSEVIERLHVRYPSDPWKSTTISAHLIGLCVNHQSSMHYPHFRRHASLFSLGNGHYRKWNPAQDGSWEVIDGRVQRLDSDFEVAQHGSKKARAVTAPRKAALPAINIASPPVTLEDLTLWRRGLLRIFTKIDRQLDREGLGGQIRRLSRTGQVPREIASLMSAIAEMRNVSEYEDKRLSYAEGEAVRHAWKAVTEWALTRGIDFKL